VKAAKQWSNNVTRFKELKRIERAIENRDMAELRCAGTYCKMRLEIATRKDHQKHWRHIAQNVQRAIADSK
jgi:hypothetical protein